MRPNGKHRQITGLRPGQFIHSGPSGRRTGAWRRRALALTLGVLLAGASVAGAAGSSRAGASASAPAAASVQHGKSPAAADPRAAAAPAAPTVLFTEDFENNPNNTTPVLLNEYVGASGETYTADPPWLEHCNGIISSFQNPASGTNGAGPWVTLCTPPGSTGTPGPAAWNDVRNLAYALGVVNGTNPSTNHAVSAFTNGANPGANLIEFATVQPIPVTANGRFLTFSVNAAEMSCTQQPAGHSMLEFFLVNGTQDIPTFTSPIIPCNTGAIVSTPGPVTSNIRAGRFVSNGSVLFTGTSLGIQMRNAQGSGLGNDHAFDDIQVLDVTPQLEKSFSPATLGVGAPSTLTFTITNTSELAAKDGWSFTDHLPAGLVLATPSAIGGTCVPPADVTAPDGGTSVTVTGGDLDVGEESCTITVNVTSASEGTFTNDASDITSTGLNPPAPAAVTFTADHPSLTLVKSARPSSFSGAGTLLTFSFLVTNTGDVPLTNVQVVDTDLPGLSAISCPSTTVVEGGSMTCTATYTTTQADVTAGKVTNTATSLGVSASSTVPVHSPPSTVVVPFRPFVPVTG